MFAVSRIDNPWASACSFIRAINSPVLKVPPSSAYVVSKLIQSQSHSTVEALSTIARWSKGSSDRSASGTRPITLITQRRRGTAKSLA